MTGHHSYPDQLVGSYFYNLDDNLFILPWYPYYNPHIDIHLHMRLSYHTDYRFCHSSFSTACHANDLFSVLCDNIRLLAFIIACFYGSFSLYHLSRDTTAFPVFLDNDRHTDHPYAHESDDHRYSVALSVFIDDFCSCWIILTHY
jgi:hypothetical protein